MRHYSGMHSSGGGLKKILGIIILAAGIVQIMVLVGYIDQNRIPIIILQWGTAVGAALGGMYLLFANNGMSHGGGLLGRHF